MPWYFRLMDISLDVMAKGETGRRTEQRFRSIVPDCSQLN